MRNHCVVASAATPSKEAPKHHFPNLLLLLLATLAAIALVLHLNQGEQLLSATSTPVHAREAFRNARPSTTKPASPRDSKATIFEPVQSHVAIGETILRDYGDPAKTPEHDLAVLAQLMNNFTLLVKTATDHPLSANEDWSRALRGWNPSHEKFLAENHIILNSRQQLVDRWGTPLFFHSAGRGQYVIRSAGPDRRLWTADDLQRNADGSFHHGASFDSSAR